MLISINFWKNPYRSIQFYHAIRQTANIIVAILLAKSLLGMEEIGVYEQLLFIGYLFTFFISTGFIQAFIIEFPKLKSGGEKTFLSQVYWIHVGLALSLLLFLLVF